MPRKLSEERTRKELIDAPTGPARCPQVEKQKRYNGLQLRFDKGVVKMNALTTISSKHQIVIPREIRERFNPRPGQKVMFIPDGNTIRLVIVPPVKDALGIFKGTGTDNIREEVDEERQLLSSPMN